MSVPHLIVPIRNKKVNLQALIILGKKCRRLSTKIHSANMKIKTSRI